MHTKRQGSCFRTKNLVKSCTVCTKLDSAQHRPLLNPDQLCHFWEIESTHVLTVKSINYIVTCDSYSIFEVDLLPLMTSAFTIKKLKHTLWYFARCGIRVKFISDNGLQFVSEEFKLFDTLLKFRHITSSTYDPRGNCTAETMVKIAKSLFNKSAIHFSLGLYKHSEARHWPVTYSHWPWHWPAPAQLLLQRRTITIVSISFKKLVLKVTQIQPNVNPYNWYGWNQSQTSIPNSVNKGWLQYNTRVCWESM